MKGYSQRNSSFKFCLLLILFYSTTVYSFDAFVPCKKDFVSPNSTSLSLNFLNEGVILHIANEITSLDKIFFKAYLLKDDSSENAGSSKDLHLKVIDNQGKVITRQLHKIEAGTVEGAVNIPKETPPGKYRLRVYTTGMLQKAFDNFVERVVYLMDDKTEIAGAFSESIEIFAEGGPLVNGEQNRVIVYNPKVTPELSSSNGLIVDEDENLVADVKMYSGQIGTAILEPKLGKSYYLKFENGQMVPLPKSVNEGYLLQVNNLDSEIAVARIIRSSNNLSDSVWLIGEIGRKEFFRHKVQWIENTATVNINKESLPTGLLMLQLSDNANQSYTSRPIFVQNHKLNITYGITDKSQTRNSLKITTLDSIGPTSSKLSVSINKYDSWGHVLPELNSLASPNPSEQENSVLVTKNQTRKRNFIQDLFLQIEYNENKTNRFSKNNPSGHIPKASEGIEFSAYVYDLNDNLLANTPIQMFVKSSRGVSILEIQSNSDGFIVIQNLDFTGTAEFTFRTEGRDTRSRLVKAIPIENEDGFVFSSDLTSDKEEKSEKSNTKKTGISHDTDTVGLIKLDEAIVTEKRVNKTKGIKSIYGIEIPAKRVKYQDSQRPKTLAQLLTEMPGVFVTNSDVNDPRVNVQRTNGQVLWVIDGYALPQDFDGNVMGYPRNSLLPVIEMLSNEDINRIDFLLGSDAGIYGSRASSGVFSITTRSGGSKRNINRKDARLLVQGYEPNIDFDSYMQKLSKRAMKKSLLLYWNPNLETDINGESIIEFSTTLNSDEKIKVSYRSGNEQAKKGKTK